MTGEKPLLPALRKQVGVLKFLGKNMLPKSKTILAEGLLLSKLKYLITMWEGTTAGLHKKLQAVINNAARIVTGKGRRTSTRSLMEETGWLTSRELTSYFTLIETWKVTSMRKPMYMVSKLTFETGDNKLKTEHV